MKRNMMTFAILAAFTALGVGAYAVMRWWFGFVLAHQLGGYVLIAPFLVGGILLMWKVIDSRPA